MQKYLFIAIGGALGAIVRYAIGVSVAERFNTRLPLGTLIINITACFIIGLSIEYLNTHVGINPAWRYMIPIGFIGAYSTYSTFEWEIWTNVTSGAFWIAISYLLLSLVLGFVAVGLGAATARSLA